MFLVTGNAPSDPGSAFWAYVRICFVVSAIAAWLIEHKKVRELESPHEPEDSLRRRTVALAEDIDTFYVRIPMMSISRSEVMAISAERSDARLFQCESVIGIRQGF